MIIALFELILRGESDQIRVELDKQNVDDATTVKKYRLENITI